MKKIFQTSYTEAPKDPEVREKIKNLVKPGLEVIDGENGKKVLKTVTDFTKFMGNTAEGGISLTKAKERNKKDFGLKDTEKKIGQRKDIEKIDKDIAIEA